MFENAPFSFQSGVIGPPINSGEGPSVFTTGSSPSAVDVSGEECCGIGRKSEIVFSCPCSLG